MTRRDYEMIAGLISAQLAYGGKEHPVRVNALADLAESFAAAAAVANPRFNAERFLAAALPAEALAVRSQA